MLLTMNIALHWTFIR